MNENIYDIPILMYHQFVEKKEQAGKIKIFVTRKTLELHLFILKILGYKTITFRDLAQMMERGLKKDKYIIITVDDGYKDNYEILFPLLKKYQMKAVIYFVTGLDYNRWTVEGEGESRFSLMNSQEVKEMHDSGLVEFGGHTLTHPSLPLLRDEELEKEILQNKKELEEIVGEEVISFAYPYGHQTIRVQEMTKKAGYKFAVSTDSGTGRISDNFFDIRRTAIDKTSLLDFLRKLSPGYLKYKYKKYGNKEFKDIKNG